MATATTSSASQQVHIEIPHFHAMYEGAVAWDACGPVAGEVAIAATQGRTPDIGNAQRARTRDIAAKRFTAGQGQTLADIAWDLNQQGFDQLTIEPYSATPNLSRLHALLKEGGLNQWPVIFEVSRAFTLPDNESGVEYHFVVSGGIDSTAGYLLANGDTQTGIRQHPGWPAVIPTNWASWGTIQAAGICGAILVHPKGWTPPPPPAPTPTVTIPRATLDTLIAQATQAAQGATTAQALESALKTLEN